MRSKALDLKFAWVVRIFGTAAAYFGVGKLSLLLAIPPGYPSPVWPAAGIALGSILLLGYRAWPGIFLGSFLINVFTSFDTTNTAAVVRSLALPTSIGAGAVLQGVVGAFLIERFVSFPISLDRPKEIFMAMVLGGPASCLINATLGSICLIMAGSIKGSDFVFNWRTWWIGDAIGVLLVIPVVCAWKAELKGTNRRTHLFVTLPITVALALTIALFIDIRKREWEGLWLRFERRVNALSQSFKSRIDSNLEILYSIEGLFKASRKVERGEFHSFVQRTLSRHEGLQALEWIPRVLDDRRALYEEEARQEGYHAFQVIEHNSQGQLVAASRRPEYFPVYFIEPFKGNEKALGFDLASNPKRLEALEKARDQGRPTATSRIKLVQKTDSEFGVLVFLPIYIKGPIPETVEGRRKSLQGYALGIFRVSEFVKVALAPFARKDIAYRLYDNSAPAGHRLLYASDVPAQFETNPATVDRLKKQQTKLHRDTALNMAGRSWILSFYPTAEYIAAERLWEAHMVVMVGLLFTSLLGAILLLITGRVEKIEQTVRERTAELTKASSETTGKIEARSASTSIPYLTAT